MMAKPPFFQCGHPTLLADDGDLLRSPLCLALTSELCQDHIASLSHLKGEVSLAESGAYSNPKPDRLQSSVHPRDTPVRRYWSDSRHTCVCVWGETRWKLCKEEQKRGKKMKSPSAKLEMLEIVLELFIFLPCELIPISVGSAHNLLSTNLPGTRPLTRGQSVMRVHVLSSRAGIWWCLRGT